MARKSRKNNVYVEEANDQLSTALYIRLSIEDGRTHSNSVENQQLILKDYIADKPEFKLYDIYIDNGLTGTNFDRPAFQRMLSDIESGTVNCVIVKDLSRLGRNAIDTGFYIEQYFFHHKTRFIAVNDHYDTAADSGSQSSIILPLKNMLNEAYSLDVGKKIKAVARQAMLDGDFVGARAPFGYRKDPNNCHKLIVDTEAAPIVKQIFEWAADGIAVSRIVFRLNETGVVTPSIHNSRNVESGKKYIKNNLWCSRTIQGILNNEIYTGDMVQGKTVTVGHVQRNVSSDEYIIVRGTHEPIVSRELFEKAHSAIAKTAEKAKAKERISYSPNIFKGKIFCSQCGAPLARRKDDRNPKSKYFFNCVTNTLRSKSACSGVFLNEAKLSKAISAALEKEIVKLGEPFSDKSTANEFQREIDSLKKQKSDRQRRLCKIGELIRGLYESLAQGLITKEDYFDFKSNYEKQAEEIKAEIEFLNNEIFCYDEKKKEYDSVKSSANSFENDRLITAELLDRLVKRIEVSHEKEIVIFFVSGRQEAV